MHDPQAVAVPLWSDHEAVSQTKLSSPRPCSRVPCPQGSLKKPTPSNLQGPFPSRIGGPLMHSFLPTTDSPWGPSWCLLFVPCSAFPSSPLVLFCEGQEVTGELPGLGLRLQAPHASASCLRSLLPGLLVPSLPLPPHPTGRAPGSSLASGRSRFHCRSAMPLPGTVWMETLPPLGADQPPGQQATWCLWVTHLFYPA